MIDKTRWEEARTDKQMTRQDRLGYDKKWYNRILQEKRRNNTITKKRRYTNIRESNIREANIKQRLYYTRIQ